MQELSGPITQLMTQTFLVEVEKKAVKTEDVLTVTKQLVHLIEEAGLDIEGRIGDKTEYDPEKHQILSSGGNLKPGDSVVVRFPGASFGVKLLRKAGVQKV